MEGRDSVEMEGGVGSVRGPGFKDGCQLHLTKPFVFVERGVREECLCPFSLSFLRKH